MHNRQLLLNQVEQTDDVNEIYAPTYEQVVDQIDDNSHEDEDCCIVIRDLDSGVRSLVDPKTINYSELVALNRKKSAWEDYWAQREINKHELFKIVNSQDEEQIISLLKLRGKEIDLNEYVYMDGWTLLHHAVNKNAVSISLTLLIYNCEVNTLTKSMHRTALHLAVLNNNEAMIHLLLAFGANPNSVDVDFCSPLHYAAEYGYLSIMRMFLWNCQALQLYVSNCRKLNVKQCCRDMRIRDLISVYETVQMMEDPKSISSNSQSLSGSMSSIGSKDEVLKRDAYNGVWTNKQGKQCLVRARSDFIQRILNQSNKSQSYNNNELGVQNPQPCDIISLAPKQTESTTSTSGATKVKLLSSLGSKISKQKYSKYTELATRSLLSYKQSISQPEVSNAESIQNYDLIKQLGAGAFGTVFLIRKKKSSKLMALKRLSKRLILENKLKKYVYAEREILKQIKHPFILHGSSFFQDPVYLYMVMEFCAGGDLEKMIRKSKFQQELARKYCCEVVLAIEELHKRNYLFRDLKPSNVLLDQSGHVKLSDFGLAKQSEMSHSFLGSVSYLAPEMLVDTDNKPHTAAIDWYLLGVFVFQMLVGIPPFFNENRMVMFEQIKRQKPRIPNHVSPECKDFLMKTLAKKPSERLGNKGAHEIKNHKWLKDVDWNAVLLKKLEMRPPEINQKQLRTKQYIQQQDLMQEGSDSNTFKGWDFCESERN